MVTAGFGPRTEDRREVLRVARHQDAALLRCQIEDLIIRQAVEPSFLGEGQDVVTGDAKRGGDPFGREVRIKQEAHVSARFG